MNRRIIALMMSMLVGISIGISTKVKAEVRNGWINTNRGWNYYENGSIKTGWLNDGDKFYYLKDDGNMATGWIKVNNNWYYMSESGSMKTGWQKVNGVWYFMQDSGEMKTGWLKDYGVWYYLNENGEMASNTSIDGYYLGADGAWVENNSTNDTTNVDNNLKNITMKTEKNIYNLGTKEITICITNNGKQPTYYGLQYEVEKFEDNKWVKVSFKEQPMFIEIAYSLEPGKTNSQVISLENLENLTAGKYRIVKLDGLWNAEFELK
jgi:hypothetical protein